MKKKAIVVRPPAAIRGASTPWHRRTLLAGLVSLPWVASGLFTDHLPGTGSVVVRQGWVLSRDD